MDTGQPKQHSVLDQNFSGKIQFDNSNQKYIFPALKISNNFATIDYDAHINTKINFTINHIFIELFKTCLLLDVISFKKYIGSSLLSLNRVPSS